MNKCKNKWFCRSCWICYVILFYIADHEVASCSSQGIVYFRCQFETKYKSIPVLCMSPAWKLCKLWPPGVTHETSSPCEQTDTSEKITFPKLPWRTTKMFEFVYLAQILLEIYSSDCWRRSNWGFPFKSWWFCWWIWWKVNSTCNMIGWVENIANTYLWLLLIKLTFHLSNSVVELTLLC